MDVFNKLARAALIAECPLDGQAVPKSDIKWAERAGVGGRAALHVPNIRGRKQHFRKSETMLSLLQQFFPIPSHEDENEKTKKLDACFGITGQMTRTLHLLVVSARSKKAVFPHSH